MTTAEVAEMSVTVNNNSPIQDYVDLDDHAQPTYEMTPCSNLSQKYQYYIIFFFFALVSISTAKIEVS